MQIGLDFCLAGPEPDENGHMHDGTAGVLVSRVHLMFVLALLLALLLAQC